MRLFFIGLLFVFLFPQSVRAQLQGTDLALGDACTAAETGRATITADSDGDLANVVLVCNGTSWVAPILEFPTSASSQAVVSDDVAAAQGFLDGTYNDYPSTDTVIIGKNTSNDVVVGGFYQGGSLFTGVVAGPGYSGFIGQTYDINDLSTSSPVEFLCGILINFLLYYTRKNIYA